MSTLKNPHLVPRRLAARVLLVILMVLPLGLLVGAVAEPSSALPLAITGLALLAPMVFALVREQTYRLWVGDDGVEVRALGLTGITQAALRFDQIEQVFMKAINTAQGGGLVGALASAALDAATRPKDGSLNENVTSITVTLVGAGKTLKMTNGNKGVVAVYRTVVDRTLERLRASAERTLSSGGAVAFGPYAIERGGVRSGKELVPFADIKDFVLEAGALRLKKEGAWFSKANPPAAKVPNVDVLLALVAEKRGTSSTAASYGQAARAG